MAGRWTFLLLAVVALLLIPNSESFATRNLDLRLERSAGGPSILCLPIEKQALGQVRRSKWNNLNFLKGFRKHPHTLVDVQDLHDERRSRWRRVLSFFHVTLSSLLQSRVARLVACWIVVMVGQFSLALYPAMATTTSSVGMLMQTAGAPGLASGTSTAAQVTAATASRAIRSFNLPAAAGVVLVAALGGLVGKKFVPSEGKEDGSVLQLTRQTKPEGEEEEGSVLQLTRQTKTSEEIEQERANEIRLKELEIRRKEEAEIRKNKEAGERLLQQTFSRYEAPAAVAPPVVEEEVTTVAVEEEVVAVEEEVIPIVVAPEAGLIEDEVVEVVLQEPVATAVVGDSELEEKKKELVQTMMGFVGMIITAISVFQYYG